MIEPHDDIHAILGHLRSAVLELQNAPMRYRPMDVALAFFAESLDDMHRRALTLGAALRLAPIIDAAVAVIPELSQGTSDAFSQEVECLLEGLYGKSGLGSVALLDRYHSCVATGVLGMSAGGQGDSLIEELLTPAMRLLEGAESKDGGFVSFHTEDGDVITCPAYGFGFEVCRIANVLVHPDRQIQHDREGIAPWVLEAIEKDSLWASLEILCQVGANADGALEFAERHSRACRSQIMQVTRERMDAFVVELRRGYESG